MLYPNKKASLLFLSILVLAVSLVLIFGAQTTFACGGCGGKGAHQHSAGGKGCPMHSEATSDSGTQQASTHVAHAPSLDDFSKEKLYTCPMHPEVRGKKSGKCPQCGMKLEKAEFYKVYTCAHEGCPSVSTKSGKCCGKDLQKKAMSKQEYYAFAELQDEYYCPMHSDVTSSQAGRCPKCGMNLESRAVPKPEEKAEAK